MKRRSILFAAGIASAVGALSTVLGACASNEEALPIDEQTPDATLTIDGGPDADASEVGPGPCNDCEHFPPACTPDVLCPTGTLDSRVRIHVIRGRSPSDVWAAGARGTILHSDGKTWTSSDPGTGETMRGLWLRDDSEVSFVSLGSIYTRGIATPDAGAPSTGGWIGHGAPPGPPAYQGSLQLESAWTAAGAEWLWCATLNPLAIFDPAGGSGLWRLHVSSANELEVADAIPLGTCATLPCNAMNSVHGSSADDLWAVGFKGAALHVTGAQGANPAITGFNSQTTATLYGVWAASANDVWAVGGAGVVRHFTGHPHLWDVVPDIPTIETLHAIWGSSGTDIWAVGDAGVVLHYDGKAWSRVKIGGLGGRRPDLYAVWTSEPGRVWIGGEGVLLTIGGAP